MTTQQAMHISTPGNWLALDLASLADEEVAGDLVDGSLVGAPQLLAHRDELIGLLTRSTAAARQARVAFAAVMIDSSGSDTPLLASLTVAVIEWSGERPAASGGQELVVLPAGEAVCFERVHPTAIVDGGAELLVLTTQYMLAPHGSQTLAVLTFTSPNVLERERLSLVFRRIAVTLELPTQTIVN